MSKNTKTTTKETKAKSEKTQPKKQSKTDLILKMVEAGKTRKQIIDKLMTISDIPRKSNAALVSRVFKAHDLLGKVPSGVERKPKKKVIVKLPSPPKGKTSTKKAPQKKVKAS